MKSICVCIQKIIHCSFCFEFQNLQRYSTSSPLKVFEVGVLLLLNLFALRAALKAFKDCRDFLPWLPLCFVVSIGPCCKSREGNENKKMAPADMFCLFSICKWQRRQRCRRWWTIFVFDYWIDVDDIDTKAVIMSDTCATLAKSEFRS